MLKKINQEEIAIIADVLANCHDWSIEDLNSEILNILGSEISNIDIEGIKVICDHFFELPVQERFSIKFNHRNFVEKQIEYYLS